METSQIIKVVVAGMAAAITLPITLMLFAEANTTGVDSTTLMVFKLLPVIISLAVGLGFFKLIEKS